MIFQRFRKPFLTERSVAQLAKQLNSICDKLDDKYDINCGGCCYTAYCIANILEKANLKYSLVALDREYEFLQESSILDLQRSCNHYAIRIKTDSNSYTINRSSFTNVNSKELKASASDILKHYKQHLWNETYDTSNNSNVQTTIEKTYYGFTKNLRKKQPGNTSISKIRVPKLYIQTLERWGLYNRRKTLRK